MNTTIVSLIAAAIYLVVGILFALRLFRRPAWLRNAKPWLMSATLIAVILHALVLKLEIFQPAGLDLSFFNVLSLVAGLVTLLLIATSVLRPLENLTIVVLPLTSAAIILKLFFHEQHIMLQDAPVGLDLHITLSILAYSLLTIAAVQSLLLYVQDSHLHNKHPGGFIRSLPPLQTMEDVLFQLITLGFILLSLALLSGAVFVENIFAQHLVHKTVLSIAAWLVFAVLLWGRRRFGWRGRIAIRWTLSGFVVLMLAYFGSKLVAELILKR